ncbi:unnamed protein product [Arctia plantaginis]|uniref:Uncharacterized protein n=1 Tax=Arctia plantaginis TaxID=874455 RepID=A0A8S0ZHW4_ARCPL|nr:unnamed protein product [Arctia plantaginis]
MHQTPTPVPSPVQIHELCNSSFCVQCPEDIILIAPDDLYGNLPTPSVSSIANSATPTFTKGIKKRTYKNDKGKKRLVHKEDWIVTKSKLLKNQRKSYSNQKGKTFPEKVMKSPCCCRLKCFEAFTEEERSNLFKKIWALGDRNKQWEYMIKYTKKQPKKRQTTEVTLHNRQFTFLYFLPFRDNQAKKERGVKEPKEVNLEAIEDNVEEMSKNRSNLLTPKKTATRQSDDAKSLQNWLTQEISLKTLLPPSNPR